MSFPPSSDSLVSLWHAASSRGRPGRLEQTCESWLVDEERDRADQFRVATSRNQHVVGRGMARKLLGGDEVLPGQIRFELHPHGKPFVTQPESARQPFNVAHTDGLVMCGIGSPGQEMVGVDVENLNRRTDPELARRYFSKPEVEFLDSLPNDRARQESFLRIWTLKEAFIKAIGTGLRTPLADFAFEEIGSDRPRIRMLNPDLEQAVSWRFLSLEPRPGFIAAVAVAVAGDEPVEVRVEAFDRWIGVESDGDD